MGYVVDALLSFAAGAVVFYLFGKKVGAELVRVELAGKAAVEGLKRAL